MRSAGGDRSGIVDAELRLRRAAHRAAPPVPGQPPGGRKHEQTSTAPAWTGVQHRGKHVVLGEAGAGGNGGMLMGIGDNGGNGGAGGAGGNVGPLVRLVHWGSGHCGGFRAGSAACLGA